MSYTFTVSDADTYFLPNNHVKAYTWRKYNATEKSAAFNQAVRELQAYLGRELEDADDDDTYRDDYASFEQCLWILEQTQRQKAEGTDEVIDLANVEDKKINVDRKGILISPTAKLYFAKSSIKMVRG